MTGIERFKTVGRIFFAALFIAAALFSALSCAKSTEGGSGTYLFSVGSTVSPDPKKFIIVIPESTPGTIFDKSLELAEQIKLYTGRGAEVIFDYLVTDNPKEGNFIFVGNTSFAQSKVLYNRLRADDFGYIPVDGNVVIGGGREEGTLAAIDKFIAEILPYSDGASLLSESNKFLFCADYIFDYILLNGFDISGFTIVYPRANTLNENRVALSLRSAILDLCGFYLQIKTDDEKAGERVITIGQTGNAAAPAAEKIVFTTDKENFSISAADTYGLSLGAKEFLNFIEESRQGKRAEVTTESLADHIYSVPDIIFMHFNYFGYTGFMDQTYEIVKAKEEEGAILYSFCNMKGYFYLENILQQSALKNRVQEKNGFFSGYFFDPAKLCEKEAVMQGGEKFDLLYGRFAHLASGEEFLYFVVNFSDRSDASLAEAARRIEEIAASFDDIYVFAVTNIEDADKDAVFGANLSVLKSGKSEAQIVGEDNPYNYSPLMYTDYEFCDTQEYRERTYEGKGKTGYVVATFKKLWAF